MEDLMGSIVGQLKTKQGLSKGKKIH
jgi:hypothetical protein